MNTNALTHTAPTITQDERLAPRLPYETPELTIYKPSDITHGGLNPKGVDTVATFTNYRVS